MSTRQQLDFVLFRSAQFNGNEKAVLGYIHTFSSFAGGFTLEQLAKDFHWSVRKLRYVIDSLVSKGVITKRYGCFKKLKLFLVDRSIQETLRGAGMVKKAIANSLKRLHKRSHRQSSAELNRQPIAESRQKETGENKTLNTGLNFSNNRILGSKMRDASQEIAKLEALIGRSLR